ncbi:hypothetical protein [uncultured Chryseobacterium sp.]|uniref:hypothetical protein n=1 Tax=uncultured Chryseobacterium sp. TaxID=259322 RepID=UPI0025DBF225|nr:hypothetical protein [uncultured Chryseobacterium sp.]
MFFCSNPVYIWRYSLREVIFETYLGEYLFDKEYIPFAIYEDWGLLCFKKEAEDTNSPVFL